jgi:hypothetical protein
MRLTLWKQSVAKLQRKSDPCQMVYFNHPFRSFHPLTGAGMFLWAYLVLNYLNTNLFYNAKEFVGAVEALPRELSKL